MTAKNKKWQSYLAVMLLLRDEAKTPTQLIRLLKIPERTLYRYLKFLYQNKLVEKAKKGKITLYRLSQLGHDLLKQSKNLTNIKQLPKKRKTAKKVSIRTSEVDTVIKKSDENLLSDVRVHDLVIKVPIVRSNPSLRAEKVNDKVRNWVEKYFKLSDLNVTVKVTTKHVICYLHSFSLPANLGFFASLGLYLAKLLISLERALWQKYRILVDVEKATIINQHYASQADWLRDVTSKNKQVTVQFNRKAVSPLGNLLNQQAWAKIDWSQGLPEIETNDLVYEEKLLLMPEKLFQLDVKVSYLIGLFSRFIESQVKFYEKLDAVMSQINNLLNQGFQANQIQIDFQKQNKKEVVDYVT